MTPKEKAKELVDKFDGVGLQQRNEAIACALICVDEIMTAIDPETNLKTWLYYKAVKHQIQKL